MRISFAGPPRGRSTAAPPVVGSTLLVLLVELINSSIEAAVDRISLERHELSGRAKDAGSAAVTIAVLICAMTWAAFCGPLLVHAIRSLF
jgi:diacylglycerol kinase (ATP)